VVYNPVIEEDEDNLRFLKDVEKWLGTEIELAYNPKYPEGSAQVVWDKAKFMSGPLGAPCTIKLKKEARQHWEKENKPDWHVLGFTVEEKKRHERFIRSERDNVIPVLIDAGYTKQDCLNLILGSGIEPPRVYKMGYPNANCIGCVKARDSIDYWKRVRKYFPAQFERVAKLEKELGYAINRITRNGEKISVPLYEIPEGDPKGADPKISCGLFCMSEVDSFDSDNKGGEV
jgi:hypothetical protein